MQTRRDNKIDPLLFDGAEEIIKVIRTLSVRQSADDPLPILSVVRPDLDEHPQFLAEICNRWLRGAEPCVPHAYVDLKVEPGRPDPPDAGLPEATLDDVRRVKDLLLDLAPELEKRSGGCFRLDRFRDVVWLMSQTLPREESMHKRHDDLHKRLRSRARGKLDNAAQKVAAQPQLPAWMGWLGWMLGGLLTPLWYRARHSGRVWPISGRYRWFLRQPNMAPGDGSFIDLAMKLTAEEWPEQVPEQVLRIMVNSLLEDLRAAFRGKGFFKKYRTTYPIVLLNHVTRANGGYNLLRIVNDIRNDTGLRDPMLLVTCSKRVPPYAFEPDHPPARADVYRPVDSTAILSAWKEGIKADQQRRSDVAWYLFIEVPEPAGGDARQGIELRLKALTRFPVPSVPIVRNRAATMALVIVLLGAAMSGYIKLGLDDSYNSCGSGFTWLGFQSHNADVVRIGDECVGVTDGSNAALLPSGPLFEQVRTTILNQNREAERLHRDQPARPLITLVFIGALTPPTSPAQIDPLISLTVEREQLGGVAVAQYQQLRKSQDSDPLVRVLIANAGQKTAHGVRVAGMLGELARRDRSIVAAIGFDESRQATMDMIRALAWVGLPVVAATLSADEFANNQMYFQVAPQNRRQAEVAAAYAAQRRDSGVLQNGRPPASRVRIYFSDDAEDIYSKNLAYDLTESFRRRQFAVDHVQFTPSGNSRGQPIHRYVADSKEAGRDACGFDGVAFYAGRPLPDFQGFLGGVSDGCKTSPPLVIAGDDTTKYVANEEIRTLNAVPFSYISFSVSPEVDDNGSTRAKAFYDQLNKMFPEMARKGRSLDGHAALTYDAAYSVITAAGYLATGNEKIPISGGTLWWALASITDDQGVQRKYDGVTGAIDFGGEVSRRVPLNKPISILRVEGGTPHANERAFCGSRVDPATQPWCPFDD